MDPAKRSKADAVEIGLDAKAMLAAIEEYVLWEPRRRGILRVDDSFKSELSGDASGEFVMLLDRQLMTTRFGHAAWRELDDFDIPRGVYRLVGVRTSQGAN
jgi:hypothetical protein